MRNTFTILFTLILMLSSSIMAQNLIDEKFDSGTFPPTGWTIDAQTGNWSATGSANSGGDAPELRLNWNPQFNGDTRIISPSIDLGANGNVGVEFKYALDHYGGPYKFGFAYRVDGGAWTVAWEKANPSASANNQSVWFNINGIATTSDFQVCFFFSGNSYNINYIYFDDLNIYVQQDHDVLAAQAIVDDQVIAGNSLTPQCIVRNAGLNTESFKVFCEIYQGETLLQKDSTDVADLATATEQTVSFGSFTPNTADELYKVVAYTKLDADQDVNNDQTFSWFDTNTEARVVLWESFTSTTCGPCASANPTTEQMLNEVGADTVLAIFYHVWWPAPGNDPFYLANTVDGRARTTDYYSVGAVPDAFVDGVVGPTLGNLNGLKTTVRNRYAKKGAFNLNAGFKKSGGDIHVRVNINTIGGVIPGNYKLRIVAIENDIDYTGGTNGETHFDWVMRKMYPDANGTELNLGKGDTFSNDFVCAIDPSWVEANTEFIVFIQNDETKEIVQTTKAVYDANVPVELTSFTAVQKGTSVELSWQTATETNNNGFEIQRMEDGESNWKMVSFKKGNGSTSEAKVYTYKDDLSNVSATSIKYRLKQIDFDGSYEYSEIVEVTEIVPFEFSLKQNYPNPFNPSTKIKFELAADTQVKLRIYNSLGQLVKVLVNENKEAGRYEINFNAANLSSGIYFYSIEAGNFTDIKKMVLLK